MALAVQGHLHNMPVGCPRTTYLNLPACSFNAHAHHQESCNSSKRGGYCSAKKNGRGAPSRLSPWFPLYLVACLFNQPSYSHKHGKALGPNICNEYVQWEPTLVSGHAEKHPRLTASNLSCGNRLACTCSASRPTAAATDAAAPGLSPVNMATTTPQLFSSWTAAAASGRGLSAKAMYPATDPSMATQQIDAPAGREHSKVKNSKGTWVKGAYAPKGVDVKYYAVTTQKLLKQAAIYRAKCKG